MKALYLRLLCAAVILMLTVAIARGAAPAPVYADVVVTYAGQSFGFGGPLRYFELSAAGGRIGFDLRTLGTPGASPGPDLDPSQLRAPGNRWQVVTFGGRTPMTMQGTCAVETFVTTEGAVRVQHVYLNCIDLDV